MTVTVGHLGMSDVTSLNIGGRFSEMPESEAHDGRYRSNRDLVALLDFRCKLTNRLELQEEV